MYYHSNEYLPDEILNNKEHYSKMLSIVGGSDIALILAGLHKVNELTLCDLNANQFNVFKSKKEFIENDPFGLNYMLFYYCPNKNDVDYFSRFSKFLPETQDFVRNNLEEIVESKEQLYSLFLDDYVEAFSRGNQIYEHLSEGEIKIDFLQGDIFDSLSKHYDVVYLSNALDFISIENLDAVIEKIELLKDDVVIYDSSKHLSETTVPKLKRYSKQDFASILFVTYLKSLPYVSFF